MCVTAIRVRNKACLGLMVTVDLLSTSSMRLIFGGLVIALELTGMSLYITKGELMKFIPRRGVRLASKAGMS